jgi:hypothetical protein
MLFERVGDLFALVQLQRAVGEFGLGTIFKALLVGTLVLLAVDYAWMIYLHYKMVSVLTEYVALPLTDQDSHLDPSHFLSSVTLTFFPTQNHGSTLKSYHVNMMPRLSPFGLAVTRPFGSMMLGVPMSCLTNVPAYMPHDPVWLSSASWAPDRAIL